MSDTENPPDNPAAELSASGTPTPKATPKGRGRGRGRKGAAATKKAAAAASAGTANAAPTANATTAPRKAAGGRRGRTKQFDDDSIQAKYERQREIKACFAELAALVKPALIDLAERETEALKRDPDYHKKQDEYRHIMTDLRSTLDLRLEQANSGMAFAEKAHKKACEAAVQMNNEVFKNGVEESEDAFLDATIRRLELLEDLFDNGRPVDEIDDSWRYKTITNEQADDFGPWKVFVNGRLAPYPHRIKGTEIHERYKAMWLEPQSAATKPVQMQPAPKVQPKRKAKGLGKNGEPDVDNVIEAPVVSIAPAKHTQSLLSAQPTALVEEEPSNESTPVPEGNLLPKEREPALPSHASEPDAFGVRTVNKPIPKNAPDQNAPSNRFIVPNFMNLEPYEIGFRDSANDRTRGVTVAKRGKYLDTNDSATLHYDPMVARHHAGLLTEEDFDKELVERHQVHPRYGFFLGRSRNDAEPPKDHVEGHNTTVYITPSGRTIHANRTIPGHKLAQANIESERQRNMGRVLAQTLEKAGINSSDIETPELEDLRNIRAAIAEQRETAAAALPVASETLESSEPSHYTPLNDSTTNDKGLLSILEAASAAELPAAPPVPIATTPARAVTRSYDAIRDMVVEHTPSEPAPTTRAVVSAPEDRTGLNMLADILIGHSFPAPPLGKRPRGDDFLAAEAPPVKRPSLGFLYDPVPATPIDPAMRPFTEEGRRDGSIAPLAPIEESSERITLPSVHDSAMRSTMPPIDDSRRPSILQGMPLAPQMETRDTYSHRRSISGSLFGDRVEQSTQNHRDIPPARPMEMVHMRESEPRIYHQDPYSNAFSRSQSYQMSSRATPSSRMPFSNPNPGHASPSLPPLRPGPPYGEPANGYFGQSAPRMSTESPYMSLQSGPVHLGGSYSAMTPGQASSQYGASIASTYPPIAPSPSGMHSPPISFSHHPLGGPELMSRGGPGSASSTPNAKLYRELAPAPLPPHRQGQHQSQELRTINYVPGDNIKDYTPTEQLPARGPQLVRSWNQYSHKNKLNMGQDRRGSN